MSEAISCVSSPVVTTRPERGSTFARRLDCTGYTYTAMSDTRMLLWVQIAVVLAVQLGFVVCYECSDGYFGDDCRGVCHCNGTEAGCDQRTGHCPGGCAEGWTGRICQTPVNLNEPFPFSVVGVSIGVGVLALFISLALTCYCLSRPSRRPVDDTRARARQERLNRLQEILHSYNGPPRRTFRQRGPGFVFPQPHKLTGPLPFLPTYQEAASTTTLVTSPTPPYVMEAFVGADDQVPPRPESPPPPYSESAPPPPPTTESHPSAYRQHSRSALIQGNPPTGIWTLT